MEENVTTPAANTINETDLYPVWFDLTEACRRKGVNKKTTQNLPWLQPNGGQPDAVVGRKKRWHRSTIARWLLQTDEELEKEFGGE